LISSIYTVLTKITTIHTHNRPSMQNTRDPSPKEAFTKSRLFPRVLDYNLT